MTRRGRDGVAESSETLVRLLAAAKEVTECAGPMSEHPGFVVCAESDVSALRKALAEWQSTVRSEIVPPDSRARELLVIGTAVTWAMAFEKGADAAFRRRTEDMLLDAVKQWRDGGMADLDRDPAVIARRAANAKVAASQAKPAKAKRARRRSRK